MKGRSRGVIVFNVHGNLRLREKIFLHLDLPGQSQLFDGNKRRGADGIDIFWKLKGVRNPVQGLHLMDRSPKLSDASIEFVLSLWLIPGVNLGMQRFAHGAIEISRVGRLEHEG